MNKRRVTWAEAELVCPGIEAEWRSMLGTQNFQETLLDGRMIRLRYPSPPVGYEWAVDLYEGVRDPFDYHGENPKDTNWMVELLRLDTKDWYMSYIWRRWPGGYWRHPFAIERPPHYERLEYKYGAKP